MTAEPHPQRAPPAGPSRLDAVTAEDYPEVAEIAFGLYQQDEARSEDEEQRRIALEAATEAGVPAPYMEQAAAMLHERRVEEVRQRRRRRTLILAGVAAAVLALAGWWGVSRLTDEPAPVPVVERFGDAPDARWALDVNPESRAALIFGDEGGREGVARIRVDRFGARPSDDTYYVNLNSTDGSKDLKGLESAVFLVRGDGLGQVRLYLERGVNERWRSPPVAVTGEWQERRIPLGQFERQTRDAAGAWRVRDYTKPGRIDRLSFKAGTFVNDLGSRGEIAIDDLRIE
jgi:hypothetical protein